MSRTPAYNSWKAMRSRVKNVPSYQHVPICEEWGTFEGFLKDMGGRPPGTSLDRIDNSKGYCKENCRWASAIDQVRNRSVTRWVEGITLTESARESGVSATTAFARVDRLGWSLDDAIRTPVRRCLRRKARLVLGKTITEWSRETGISLSTISARLKAGWSSEDAISLPAGCSEAYHRKADTGWDFT